jgi:long-chain acyl-CoA synthetase
MGALEDRYQVDLGETEFSNAQTVGDLERLIQQKPAEQHIVYHYPRWAQSWPIRFLRMAAYHLLQAPAIFLLGRPEIRGRENVRGVDGPVILVSNHITYFDPAYVLAALPERLRRELAVAMGGERREGLRKPAPGTGFFRGLYNRAGYYLVVALFNVFPLPMLAGFRKSFEYAGELVDRGRSVLIFPEGELTPDGRIAPFRAGIGLLATRLRLPVVPIRLEGLFELQKAGKRRARPGEIRVTVGTPVRFKETDAPEAIARELERRVAALGSEFA